MNGLECTNILWLPLPPWYSFMKAFTTLFQISKRLNKVGGLGTIYSLRSCSQCSLPVHQTSMVQNNHIMWLMQRSPNFSSLWTHLVFWHTMLGSVTKWLLQEVEPHTKWLPQLQKHTADPCAAVAAAAHTTYFQTLHIQSNLQQSVRSLAGQKPYLTSSTF